MGLAYYNEHDPKAAAWIRELIKEGHIADGLVDERSIIDVRPDELVSFTQCHFFAGIGGWSYALRLAGVPDSTHVWTGSCPCQPFSDAGKGGGVADERHLWPAWFHLIEERRPSLIFGEQVASKDGLGWLDLVSDDLEGAAYAVGAVDICAASVGAPHIRQRLYFVADGDSERFARRSDSSRRANGPELETSRRVDVSGRGGPSELAFGEGQQSYGNRDEGRGRPEPTDGSRLSVVGYSHDAGSQGRCERRNVACERPAWEASLVSCRDGKRRPIEPGSFPLANGVPERVGLLRGYGNAIVAPLAATFIEAYYESVT